MEATTKETALTPEEAAEIVGCSAYTIRALARTGEIPFYRAGKMYRFTRSTLIRWIDQQEKENYQH